MAKSIYEILAGLTTETSVPDHGMVEHTFPRELLPTDLQFENEAELLAWAEEKDIVHSCLQKGVQKFLIDLRATFKACKKDETWTEEMGQKAVDNAEWNITKRPEKSDKETIKKKAIFDANIGIAKAMKATTGISDEMILTTLTESCGKEMAQEIIDSLE